MKTKQTMREKKSKMANQQSAQALGLDQDPMVKFQNLVPILRESVSNVIQHAVYILHNTSSESTTRKNDLPVQIQGLLKIVEDFHNICDQVQIWLNLAIATSEQTQMSAKFSPQIVGGISTSQDPSQSITSYADYLTKIRQQVASAKKLEALLAQYFQQVAQFKPDHVLKENFINLT